MEQSISGLEKYALLVCFLMILHVQKKKTEDHIMTKIQFEIARQLHCTPTSIPVEFRAKAQTLVRQYIEVYSLSGLYRMDENITYNYVCNKIQEHLAINSDFNPKTFSKYVNFRTMFYSIQDIQTLAQLYKHYPNEAFPYVICFFAQKLSSFKKDKISIVKTLDKDDVDSALMLALYNTLEHYNPNTGFSFFYLEKELLSALMQLGGQMHLFHLNRNNYSQYNKFCYYVEKYGLTPDNLAQFLYEITLPPEEFASANRLFPIDARDYRYSLNIPLQRATEFLDLYRIEHTQLTNLDICDSETDVVLDVAGGTIDSGFVESEWMVYGEQTFSDRSALLVIQHLLDTGSTTLTSEDLKRMGISRYTAKKIIDKFRDDFTR